MARSRDAAAVQIFHRRRDGCVLGSGHAPRRWPMFTRLVLSFALLVLWQAPVKADTLEAFTALLNGAQETPPVHSPSTGVAFVTLDKDTSMVCYALSYSP